MNDYMDNYKRWNTSPKVDEKTKDELLSLSEDEIKMRFSGYMSFGTGGLRSIIGAGTAMMNVYTVAHVTEGLARLIKDEGADAMAKGVAIAYDSRHYSHDFANRAAEVLTANGIKVYIYPALRPTPMLSFAVRYLGCIAGINVTASHNPAEYNGYKVYWEDGAQLSPEHAARVSDEVDKLDIFDDVPTPSEANSALLTVLDSSVDNAYIDNVLAQMVNPDAISSIADRLAVVYTPIHGTGATIVSETLRRAGLKKLYTVDKQMTPDGDFPTVKFPNPEFPETFVLGIGVAEENGSDLIIATDPDADRVGVMARDKTGVFKCITGNQMGALLLDYIITAYEESGKLPADAYAVKTIVTSELAAEICRRHGVKIYNVLTGFKFIGEVIKEHEMSGNGTFLFGFEESYGYLKGTYARDKDAVVASLLITEMAAFYKSKNMTLCDALDSVFERYGYYRENVFSITMSGLDGKERMSKTMESLRQSPPDGIAGHKIVEFRDYENEYILDLRTGAKSPTGLPKSDVLYYVTDRHDVIVVRPSGTEPKIKVYVLTSGESSDTAARSASECAEAMKELLG